jgi:NitT/TauT family transport system permease protein
MKSGETSMTHTNPPRRILWFRFILFVLIIFGWEILGSFGSLSFFISRPSSIARELALLCLSGSLYYHFLITAGEAIVGLALGSVVGATIGLLLWYSSTLAQTLHPFIIIAGSIPLVALAPLFIIWFGIGFQMKVALSFFSTVFLSLSQSYRGASKVSGEYLDVLTAMQASSHEKFFKVIVPGSLDWVLSSMRLNVGLGLLGAFLGEFIASEAGLGHIILRATSLYNVSQSFAAAVGIAALALIFDFIGAKLEKHKVFIVQIVSVPRILWLSKYRNNGNRWRGR